MPGIIRRRLPLGYANIAIIYLISAELLVIMSAPCKKTRCAIGNTRLPRQFHRWIASDQSKVSGAHLRWLHCLLRAIVQLPLLASKHTYIPHSNRVSICRRFTLLYFTPLPLRRAAGLLLGQGLRSASDSAGIAATGVCPRRISRRPFGGGADITRFPS